MDYHKLFVEAMTSTLKKSHPQRAPVKLSIGIKDVMDLIPEYSGKSEMEFIHFRRGCEDALSLLGVEHEKTILKFLKLKLKGLARGRFAVIASLASSLRCFLDTVAAELCGEITNASFWEEKVKGTRQQVGESARDYGARMEEVLACAWMALGELPASIMDMADREFKRNMISERVRDYLNDPDDTRADIIDAVRAAERWAEVYADRIKCKVCNSIAHTDDKCCRAKDRDSPNRGGFLLGDCELLKKRNFNICF